MKSKAKEKIQNDLYVDEKEWKYLNELKENFLGFVLKKEMQEDDDVFNVFSYENSELHKSVNAYFHEETMEYKLSITIGLITFCDISFFTNNIMEFEKNLRENLEEVIQNLAKFDRKNISYLLEEKEIFDWKYDEILPNELEGFSLFSTPKTPTKITNGSYIIFDYVDFSINSGFTIYYNIFRDEFFGESRVKNLPIVTYDFDSKNIKELEEKLKKYMVNYLKDIREKA